MKLQAMVSWSHHSESHKPEVVCVSKITDMVF